MGAKGVGEGVDGAVCTGVEIEKVHRIVDITARPPVASMACRTLVGYPGSYVSARPLSLHIPLSQYFSAALEGGDIYVK